MLVASCVIHVIWVQLKICRILPDKHGHDEYIPPGRGDSLTGQPSLLFQVSLPQWKQCTNHVRIQSQAFLEVKKKLAWVCSRSSLLITFQEHKFWTFVSDGTWIRGCWLDAVINFNYSSNLIVQVAGTTNCNEVCILLHSNRSENP